MYNGRKKEKGSVNQHTVAKVQNEPLQTTAEVIAKGNYGTACTKCGRKANGGRADRDLSGAHFEPPKTVEIVAKETTDAAAGGVD